MKKTTLFLACCIGLLFFASCKKDPVTPVTPDTPTTPDAPTITVMTGNEYAGQGTQMYAGNQITVGFNAIGEKLTKIELNVTLDGESIYSNSVNIESQNTYSYTHTFTIDAVGTLTITGTVTDIIKQTGTTSFNITSLEKPNAKFLGHYEGDILITGTADVELTNMEPMHEDFENQPFPVVVDIEEDISGFDKVIANISINGQTNQVNGTVTDNKVVFEAINHTFTYNYSYQGFTIPIPLNMTYTINGTLNGEQLDLDGDCNGVGDINLPFLNINGTFAMVGTIGGSLDKN